MNKREEKAVQMKIHISHFIVSRAVYMGIAVYVIIPTNSQEWFIYTQLFNLNLLF